MIRKIVRHLRHLGAKSQKETVVNTVPSVREDVSDIFDLLHKVPLPIVPVKELHTRLGYREPLHYPEASMEKPLTQWEIETDDAPIFRYIYRTFRPRRHLEFGTWQGAGTVYCLEECEATVWTINLPFGDFNANGIGQYGYYDAETNEILAWAQKIGMNVQKEQRITDTLGFIGRFYLGKNLGNRVCQIYCDSGQWDISNYPAHFFDSVLIDGGHYEDVVINDTCKALTVLRSGGLIMWHDFCPDRSVIEQLESPRGVLRAVLKNWHEIDKSLSDIFWIKPSWILLGVKR
jgi:hypothetical protein